MQNKSRAFTLIELLVVVLIIGILAAIAVPQYRLAVLKGRYVQLMSLGNGIYKAAQSYYLANGSYPGTFSVLDLDIPGTGENKTRTFGDYSCRLYVNEDYVSDSFFCWYATADGNMGYKIHYRKGSSTCYASTTWTLGNQLCRNLTGTKDAAGTYGDGNAGANFYNTYNFQ